MNRMDKEHLLQQTLGTCKQIPARINLSHICQQLSACQYWRTLEAAYTPVSTGGIVELCCFVAEKLDPHSSPPRSAVLQQPAGRSCRRGSSFDSQELLPADVSSLAETLHGGRLSSPVAQRSQITWT